MHRSIPIVALLIAAPLLAQNAPPPAKPAHFQGQVVDSTGRPIRAAVIETDDPPKATVSDDDGFFKFAELPPGPITVRVRHIGFTGIDFQIRLMADSTVSIGVKLFAAAQMLAPVEVDAGAEGRHPQLAQVGFYQRMRAGWGRMVTPEDIDKKRATAPAASWFLQDIVGVTVRHGAAGPSRGRGGQRNGANGAGGGAMVYGKSTSGGDCVMNLIVNGAAVKMIAGETFDNFVSTTELYAVETYARAAQVPAEYQTLLGNDFCGAVIVWTTSRMTVKP